MSLQIEEKNNEEPSKRKSSADHADHDEGNRRQMREEKRVPDTPDADHEEQPYVDKSPKQPDPKKPFPAGCEEMEFFLDLNFLLQLNPGNLELQLFKIYRKICLFIDCFLSGLINLVKV